MIIPASFSIATLFPCCAIRPNLPALDLTDVDIEEKTSFWGIIKLALHFKATRRMGSETTHTAIYQTLIPCIVVYVYRDAS